MKTLLMLFIIIFVLALVFGGLFFLIPLFSKVLRLSRMYTFLARYIVVTFFLATSTYFCLVYFSVSEMLAYGIIFVIVICVTSLVLFRIQREVRTNRLSGGTGDRHPGL